MRSFWKGEWTRKNLPLWITTIMVLTNTGLAMAILIGGRRRFTLPSYTPLIDYTHGQIWIWGVWILLAAVLMASPYRKLNIAGLWLSMFWHIIWMSAFTLSLYYFDDTTVTPIPAYAGLALISAALLTFKILESKK